MDRYVTISNRTYSLETLKLLTGKMDVQDVLLDIPEELLYLCEVIDHPHKLPYYIEAFFNIKLTDEDVFRFALMRVQVDSDLRTNEDIQKHQNRKYVSRTIEKLVFADILLEDIQNIPLEGE
ncbi:hypothetical protein V7O66_03250 [Methanolobus sp. ZRKC3]|uniref:hypothetical protein n=1 Tax=Methanolobus sp. ZRKC3 TaxID=3125786 RepID=UPI00324808A9